MTSPSPVIRLASVTDASAINDILNYYVHTTTTFNTEPLPLPERQKQLTNRPAIHPALVAELDGRVVGFAALGAFRQRAAYANTAELSINVHHDFHCRGIGRLLLAELITLARTLGLHVLIGGCCAENAPSIALLEAAFGPPSLVLHHDQSLKQ